MGEHAQTYALQLDQSDSFSMANPSAIPEPSSLILLSLALLSGVVLRNRYFTKK
ncbi:MAG: PEP-CTERM sorting domain-containing protein [Kiritimatiellae bacterium]|nr:PEP-CTERM sorting domain-containing protein [Kiritimatiellia bacterium]